MRIGDWSSDVCSSDLVAADAEAFLDGLLVAPGDVLHRLVANGQRPVAGGALERAIGAVLARHQEAHGHVLARQVVGWGQARLAQHQGPGALGAALAVAHPLPPLSAGLQAYAQVAGGERLRLTAA